jgi:hypothetical protein
MTTDIPDWIAFFAIVGMEEFRLILKGTIVFIAYDSGSRNAVRFSYTRITKRFPSRRLWSTLFAQ